MDFVYANFWLILLNLFGLLPGRVTYIVNKAGNVVFIFNSQIQAEKHIDEAIRILKELK